MELKWTGKALSDLPIDDAYVIDVLWGYYFATGNREPIQRIVGALALSTDKNDVEKLTIGSMVLKPGESTIIESSVFMMHAGMDGPHNFAVHLKTNDPENPDMIVNVLSNWIP